MSTPLVSVIIPTYNGASFLGKAIQSILDQTYSNLELIIVDDKSPDNTADVVKQYRDHRLKYICHENNQGAATARGTGRRNSSGEIIAFLDQDDRFHPEKIEAHVTFLNEHPEVGFTYNPFFVLLPSSEVIRTVMLPPKDISLEEITLGFPLPPSSWVVRREWAFLENVWDVYLTLRGREIVVCGRLFMEGCKFARVDRVLHYRGYHAGRIVKELDKNCQEELTCQDIIFSDPRCPPEVAKMRSVANAHINLNWATVAFTQNETALGQTFLREAVCLNPSLLEGFPSPVTRFLMDHCIDDESGDFETLLSSQFSQFPPEIPSQSSHYLWALSWGYLFKGVRATIWGRSEDARHCFARAGTFEFVIDETFIQQITQEMMVYELCYGTAAALAMLSNLSIILKKNSENRIANWVKGSFLINKAFQNYHDSKLRTVPGNIISAIVSSPRYLSNRGVMSILFKSMMGFMSKSGG
jgi:glycosyltransferase involved in cell wall biosynthesis